MILTGLPLYQKPGKTLKNLKFDNLGKNNLEKPGIREILKKTWKNLEI